MLSRIINFSELKKKTNRSIEIYLYYQFTIQILNIVSIPTLHVEKFNDYHNNYPKKHNMHIHKQCKGSQGTCSPETLDSSRKTFGSGQQVMFEFRQSFGFSDFHTDTMLRFCKSSSFTV